MLRLLFHVCAFSDDAFMFDTICFPPEASSSISSRARALRIHDSIAIARTRVRILPDHEHERENCKSVDFCDVR